MPHNQLSFRYNTDDTLDNKSNDGRIDDTEDAEDVGEIGSLAERLLRIRAAIDRIIADMAPELDGDYEYGDTADEYGTIDTGGTGEHDSTNVSADDVGDTIYDGGSGDRNYEGVIRTVAGANLIYKTKDRDGNYTELWIYNVGNDAMVEARIRRAILAGTDIQPSSQESEDGSQQAETSTIGNVQFLKISGLPN